jgi:HEPN domain-containing protein
MKERHDLARGWLRKAESDIVAMDASFDAGSLDSAAFHAQQAVEKLLKAFLVSVGADFPFTHNLAKLVELCANVDPSFNTIVLEVEPLTPYAVQLRYDTEFWPSDEDLQQARSVAKRVRDFVCGRLPRPD